MSSVASEGSPCNSLSVHARGIAGSPGRAGGGACGAITSAVCGNTASWLRKSISVCQPTGTTSVSCPSRNALKVRAPFSRGAPAIHWKRTVLAAGSDLRTDHLWIGGRITRVRRLHENTNHHRLIRQPARELAEQVVG